MRKGGKPPPPQKNMKERHEQVYFETKNRERKKMKENGGSWKTVERKMHQIQSKSTQFYRRRARVSRTRLIKSSTPALDCISFPLSLSLLFTVVPALSPSLRAAFAPSSFSIHVPTLLFLSCSTARSLPLSLQRSLFSPVDLIT